MTLIFLLALVLLYVVGFVVSLFISRRGGSLSLIAFFTMVIALMLKGRLNIFDGTKGVSWISLQSLKRLRRYSRLAMPTLGVLFVAALIATFSQPGVCDTDTLPVLAHREHYVLVSHGVYTEASRLRYYLAGLGFLTGWNSIMLLVVMEALGRYVQKEIYRREG